MTKFKITVETKSRSKVVIEIDTTHQEIHDILIKTYDSTTLRIKDTFFNTSNVNYIQVEEIE